MTQEFHGRPSKHPALFLLGLLATAGCAPVNAPAPPRALSVESAPAVVGVASVIDGDTIEIHGERIRLHGIDAPESSQLCDLNGKPWRCGQSSANALSDYIGRRPVTCEPKTRDRYGRLVAMCSVAGTNISAWMVLEGWAVAYRRYSQDFVADEAAARSARRGIWGSSFVLPWEWRAQRRAGGVVASRAHSPSATSENHRAGCDIKGNINSKGDRIYHMPCSRYYESTLINTAHGERWFCSEAEARAAGWRPPKQ